MRILDIRFLLIIVGLGAYLSVVQGNMINVDWDQVDLLLEEFRRVNEVPGVALAVVDSSGLQIGAKGYGVSDREENRPMDNSTRFLIASISKSFTAVISCRVLSLHFPEMGESVLDTPIVRLAPGFNLTLIDRYRTEQTTFRDLLSHRTCLSSYGIGVTAGAYKSRADRLYRYRYIGEKCAFRSGFEYSSAMFILAGEIIAHIAEVPFENLAMELLAELGMTDSLIVTPSENYETLERMSRGYYRNLDGQLAKMNASVYNSHSGAASGGIISTSADMGRYIRFHLNKGLLDEQQIVPTEIMDWVYRASNSVPFPGLPFNDVIIQGDFGYGLGLDLGLFGNLFRVGHIGDLSPFTSRMTFYPEVGLGLFTAINGPGPLPATSDHLHLHNQLTQLILEGTQPPTSRLHKNSCPEHESIVPKSVRAHEGHHQQQQRRLQSEALVGVYGHPYEGDVHISIGPGGGLELQYGIWGYGSLLETDETNVYEIEWRGDIVAIFLAYSAGPPLPSIRWDFNTLDTLTYEDPDGRIEYRRNATIETYPEIPWSPDSCLH